MIKQPLSFEEIDSPGSNFKNLEKEGNNFLLNDQSQVGWQKQSNQGDHQELKNKGNYAWRPVFVWPIGDNPQDHVKSVKSLIYQQKKYI